MFRAGHYSGYKYQKGTHWAQILKSLIPPNEKITWKDAIKKYWKPFKAQNPNKTKLYTHTRYKTTKKSGLDDKINVLDEEIKKLIRGIVDMDRKPTFSIENMTEVNEEIKELAEDLKDEFDDYLQMGNVLKNKTNLTDTEKKAMARISSYTLLKEYSKEYYGHFRRMVDVENELAKKYRKPKYTKIYKNEMNKIRDIEKKYFDLEMEIRKKYGKFYSLQFNYGLLYNLSILFDVNIPHNYWHNLIAGKKRKN